MIWTEETERLPTVSLVTVRLEAVMLEAEILTRPLRVFPSWSDMGGKRIYYGSIQ